MAAFRNFIIRAAALAAAGVALASLAQACTRVLWNGLAGKHPTETHGVPARRHP